MRYRHTLCLLLAMLAILLLGGTAGGAEAPSSLPPELAQAAPEAAELLEGSAEDGFGLSRGAERLWRQAVSGVGQHLLSGARSIAAILAGVVLLGAAESLSRDRGGVVERCATAGGALWITAVSAGSLDALIGLGRETVNAVSALSTVLFPALAAATAASGGVTSASVRQVGAVFFSNVLLTLIRQLLLPLVYLYIGLAAAGAVLEEGILDSLGNLVKKLVGWLLTGLLGLFTAYLTISGAVAGAADAQAVRLARSALSAAVPVVGGVLAEAAESVLAGAGLLRGMLGSFGALAVLSLVLAPALRLGAQYLLYQGAALVAEAAGPKNLTGLLRRLGDAFGLVLAMTASSALLLLISLVSSLTAVTP